jgi:hypothetical protein
VRLEPLRHRDPQQATVCLGEKAPLHDGAPGVERFRQSEAAEQPILGDVRGQPEHGAVLRRLQLTTDAIAQRTRGTVQPHAAQAMWVDRK